MRAYCGSGVEPQSGWRIDARNRNIWATRMRDSRGFSASWILSGKASASQESEATHSFILNARYFIPFNMLCNECSPLRDVQWEYVYHRNDRCFSHYCTSLRQRTRRAWCKGRNKIEKEICRNTSWMYGQKCSFEWIGEE